MDIFGDLRHRGLLAERGAEQELVAGPRQFRGFAAHDLGDAGFGRQRGRDLDRSRIAGTEQDVRFAIQRLLNLRARDAGVRLRIGVGDFDLVAENAALGIDLLDREIDAVFPVGADGGAAAREFGDVGELDSARRRESSEGGGEPDANSAPVKNGFFISIPPCRSRRGLRRAFPSAASSRVRCTWPASPSSKAAPMTFDAA